MTMNWNSATYQLSQKGQAYVLVTLVGVSGSTPRNSGTKMVISKDQTFGTIGGGHLEHKTIKHAQKMLIKGNDAQHLEHFQLGSNLGQCCGGNASVLFECFAAVGVNIMLFGAGHVGKALIPILAHLPCQITWVDNREEQFPSVMNTDSEINRYPNVHKVISQEPEREVAGMPENSYYIVMTHNHQLDFDISHTILKRGDFTYLGLIASDTKWRRFQQRYKHREVDQQQVNRMSCPIGLTEVAGKLPMEVAVSVAAEIITIYQNETQRHVEIANLIEQKQLLKENQQAGSLKSTLTKQGRPTSQQGIYWKELKPLLITE